MCWLLLPWRAFNAVDVAEGFRGSVARYLGLLATATGRLDDAQIHFEEALARNEEMLAGPWLARTQSDYAQMLRARNLGGDAERADQLREQAGATSLELGLSKTYARRQRAASALQAALGRLLVLGRIGRPSSRTESP